MSYHLLWCSAVSFWNTIKANAACSQPNMSSLAWIWNWYCEYIVDYCPFRKSFFLLRHRTSRFSSTRPQNHVKHNINYEHIWIFHFDWFQYRIHSGNARCWMSQIELMIEYYTFSFHSYSQIRKKTADVYFVLSVFFYLMELCNARKYKTGNNNKLLAFGEDSMTMTLINFR